MKIGLAILSVVALVSGGSYFTAHGDVVDTGITERTAFYEKCAADNPDPLKMEITHPCQRPLNNPRRYGKPFCAAGWC